jgi:hypothetical protein
VASYKKAVADAKAKIAKAEARAFIARMEAIVAILEGADPDDIVLLCASALTNVAPLCCDEHLDDFKEELLRMLDGCVAVAREHEEHHVAEADDTPPQVH